MLTSQVEGVVDVADRIDQALLLCVARGKDASVEQGGLVGGGDSATMANRVSESGVKLVGNLLQNLATILIHQLDG